MSEPVIYVAAVCGSLRPGSYTRMALQYALRGAGESGAETRLVDLRDYSLVFADGKRTTHIRKGSGGCGRM